MARILEIQKRSNSYIANLEANVTRVIESKQRDTVDLNRLQMLSNKDADGKPLIHKSTKSQYLTKAYAKKTGKSKPDLWVRGDFQEAMFMIMPSVKEYFISSKNYLTLWLAKNYGKIFGVAPGNQPKAQKINDKAVAEDYLKKVFQ